MLRTEREPAVLEALVAGWDADWMFRLSISALLDVCRANEPCSPDLRSKIIREFWVAPPSREAAQAAFDHHNLMHAQGLATLPYDYESFDGTARVVLASFGEHDLAPVIEATASTDDHTRELAIHALVSAVRAAPLELPEALAAFDRASNDPVRAIAEDAALGARLYRRAAHEPPELAVVRILATNLKEVSPNLRTTRPDLATRLLGVRRFSCRTPVAREVLELLRTHPAQSVSISATLALRMRAERCAREPNDTTIPPAQETP